MANVPHHAAAIQVAGFQLSASRFQGPHKSEAPHTMINEGEIVKYPE